jgi:hypothetical protein
VRGRWGSFHFTLRTLINQAPSFPLHRRYKSNSHILSPPPPPTCQLSMLEIYNETVRDLLGQRDAKDGGSLPKLEIRMLADGVRCCFVCLCPCVLVCVVEWSGVGGWGGGSRDLGVWGRVLLDWR